MTEIEKMYENANIKQDRMCEWTCKDSKTCNQNCEHYGSIQLYYPPFTAEKQLGLIKLLGNIRDYIVEIDKFKGVYYVGCREAGSNNKHWGSHNIFEEALAELINDLWQDLTDQEKEEIRNILNENS